MAPVPTIKTSRDAMRLPEETRNRIATAIELLHSEKKPLRLERFFYVV